jgi:hypothetical protein
MQIQNAAKLCQERRFPWMIRHVDTGRYPARYRVVLDIDTVDGSYSLPIAGWDGCGAGTVNGEVLVGILATSIPPPAPEVT